MKGDITNLTYDDEYEIMRGEILAYARKRNRIVLESFCQEIGYDEPIGYYNQLSNHTMTIYATRPGCIIGKAGKNVELLKTRLKEEFGYDYTIKFEEVRGDFINLNNAK